MVARNHHYIPQCYLKGFARHRDKPKIFVVDRQTRATFQANPSNIAVERDFHTIDVDGVPTDALEAEFSKFETRLAPALVRITHDGEVNIQDDKIHLINLIAMLAVKNPLRRKWLMDFDADIFDHIIEHVSHDESLFKFTKEKAQQAGFISNENDVDQKKLKEFIKNREYYIDVERRHYLELEIKLFDSVLEHCSNRSWILIRAPKNSSGFVTSDNPVCLRWSNSEMAKSSYSPGHGLKNTEVLFPISSGLAWIGTFEHHSRTIDVNEEQVRKFNSLIVHSCYRQVYGRDGDCGYLSHTEEKPWRICELPKDSRFHVRQDRNTRVRIARERVKR